MMPLITILCVYVCVKGGGGGGELYRQFSQHTHVHITTLPLRL